MMWYDDDKIVKNKPCFLALKKKKLGQSIHHSHLAHYTLQYVSLNLILVLDLK